MATFFWLYGFYKKMGTIYLLSPIINSFKLGNYISVVPESLEINSLYIKQEKHTNWNALRIQDGLQIFQVRGRTIIVYHYRRGGLEC